jgi:hypothetical protein
VDERRLIVLRVIRPRPTPYGEALAAFQCQTGDSSPKSADEFAGVVHDLIALKWIDYTPGPGEGVERALWLRPRGEAVLESAKPE